MASLLILHEMMVQIKESCGLEKIPKPCEYFHMIGGTSTGGYVRTRKGLRLQPVVNLVPA